MQGEFEIMSSSEDEARGALFEDDGKSSLGTDGAAEAAADKELVLLPDTVRGWLLLRGSGLSTHEKNSVVMRG